MVSVRPCRTGFPVKRNGGVSRVPVAVCRAVLYRDRRAWCVPHRRVRVLFLVQADTPAATAVLVVSPLNCYFHLVATSCPAQFDRMYVPGNSYDPTAGVSSTKEKRQETASQTRGIDAVILSRPVLPLAWRSSVAILRVLPTDRVLLCLHVCLVRVSCTPSRTQSIPGSI